MFIKDLCISKIDTKTPELSWSLSNGEQSSFELFLIQGGSVAEMIKESSGVTRCSLRTMIEPMKEYAVLLTVKSGRLLSTARVGFHTASDTPLPRRVLYQIG